MAEAQLPWRVHGPLSPSEGVPEAALAFSVVVPAYNEESGIAGTLDAIRAALASADGRYEVIVVNDGSSDGTSDVLRTYLEAHPDSIRVVDQDRNRGYGAALKAGIRVAQSEVIAITDADGTYPVDRIPDLVEALVSQDVSMVVGSRVGDDVEYSWVRRIPKVFLKAYIDWIARTDVPDFNSGLRVFRRDVAEKFLGILPNKFSFTTTITLACITNNYPVVFQPISYSKRVGKSKIQPVRDTLRFSQLIVRTGMYFAPLRVLGPIAMALGLLAFVSLSLDVFVLKNLTDSTVLLFLFTLNTGMFALLADMIDKRTPK